MHTPNNPPPQGYVTQLRAAGLTVFPCRVTPKAKGAGYDKQPATGKGNDWRDPNAKYTSHDYSYFGVPVPEGCLVLDLDSYKCGGTLVARAAVDTKIGVALPWDAAMIQRTVSGGEHYAFRMPDYVVSQGNGLPELFLDLRVGGQGFIASGVGYSLQNFGMFSLSSPATLPALPLECRAFFENKAPLRPVATDSPLAPDAEEVRTALSFIDPDMPYDAGWIKVVMALRHYFDHDQDTGLTILHEWSAGEYWPGDTSPNYDVEKVTAQYTGGVKAQRGNGANVTIGTVFHAAGLAGYKPPVQFVDAQAAFAGEKIDVLSLRELISEKAGAPGALREIVETICASRLDEFQLIEVHGQLEQALRDAGQWNKNTKRLVDGRLTPQHKGRYAGNDTQNGLVFMADRYPGGDLVRCNGEWYAFNGKVWSNKHRDSIFAEITEAMTPDEPQVGKIKSAMDYLAGACHKEHDMTAPLGDLVVFNNCILDLNTGSMHPHRSTLYTTNILPYDYAPGAVCPEWAAFLHVTFEGDADRIALLQEWLGYMMSTSRKYQKLMLFLGPRRAGKGAILRVLSTLVGHSNFAGGSLPQLLRDPMLHSLSHKTVFADGDVQKHFNGVLREPLAAQIKKITGNDEISFERKYLDSVSMPMPIRITLSGNHIPRLFDDSGALHSRMLVLPFEVSFYAREDVELESRLRREVEGIALWALQGLHRLRANGCFTEPDVSREEIREIADSYSPLTKFVTECCDVAGDDVTPTGDLYDAYRAWAVADQQHRILDRSHFTADFRDTMRGKCRPARTMAADGRRLRAFSGIKIKDGTPTGHPAFQPAVIEGRKP